MQNISRQMLTAATALTVLVACAWSPSIRVSAVADGTGENEEIVLQVSQSLSYEDYQEQQKETACPTQSIAIPLASEEIALQSVAGRDAVITDDDDKVTWAVQVPVAGWYRLAVDYYPLGGKTTVIERRLLIDGQVPFTEAGQLRFSRLWADETETDGSFAQDRNQNDITPNQVEKPAWVEGWLLRDLTGYYNGDFRFYFTAGEHTLTLESMNEPMAVGGLSLQPVTELADYATVSEQWAQQGYTVQALENVQYYQAEHPTIKSDSVLIPTSDRSSPTSEPYHISKIRLNTIGGGERWNAAGQWVEWTVNVPAEGLYSLSFKVRQNTARGMAVSRKLYINGEVPFKEAENLTFFYSAEWRSQPLQVNGETSYVYLKAGENTLRLEATLGEMSECVRRVQALLTTLNACYRKIIIITSTVPDVNRDYMLDTQIPDVIQQLGDSADEMEAVAAAIKELCHGKNSSTAQMESFAYQLRRMHRKPGQIQRMLSDFNSNLSALGTSLVNLQATPLEMDYFTVSDGKQSPKRAEATFWEKAQHELSALVMSFVEDYSIVGSAGGSESTITVWINSGRDQANALKTLVDSTFTPKTNIGVNLKLVQGALLQATVAGLAPDVALGLGAGDPVNYAMRGAVADLSKLDGFDEVSKRFSESAKVPFRYQGGSYALPEKESWLMLFYRSDILAELGLSIPQTWDDVYALLPTLQRNSMNFGVPVTDMSSGSAVGGAGVSTFGSLLYQYGGTYYKENGKYSNLDSEEAIAAFSHWTNLYTAYSLPTGYNFSNRFRSGEMPLAIADYTLYSTLVAFAPEIRGLWGFTVIPGVRQENGEVNHSAANSVTSCVIMEQCADKSSAWAFLDWYTTTDTQVRYARILESVMGETARYPVSNLEALEQLPWSSKDYAQLNKQRQWVVGREEVPGGYYTTRHIDNIFRTINNKNEDVRETVLNYVRMINKEIEAKRSEFGLS